MTDPLAEYGCRAITIVLKCTADRVDESTVEILDISEDILGRDVLAFRCPVCGNRHESYRYG